MLRQEIDLLKARVDDLCKAQNIDREETSKTIKDVYTSCYGYIGDLFDYLWPVLHKLYPQIAESQKQIDALMKRRRRPGDEQA